MARITHPRPQPGRQKFIGITFRDGFADVDELHPEVRQALTQHGYGIEDTLIADPSDEPPFEPLPPAADTEKASKPRKPKTLDNFNHRPYPQPPALAED